MTADSDHTTADSNHNHTNLADSLTEQTTLQVPNSNCDQVVGQDILQGVRQVLEDLKIQDLSIQGPSMVEDLNQETSVANELVMEDLQDSLVLLPIGKRRQAREKMDTTKARRSHMWSRQSK